MFNLRSPMLQTISRRIVATMLLSLISFIPNALWSVESANAAASTGSITNQVQWVGGGGGNQDINCAVGSILRGATSGYNTSYPGLTYVRAICDVLTSDGLGTTNSTTVSSAAGGSDTTGAGSYSIDCGQNRVLVGVSIFSPNNTMSAYVTPRCASLPIGSGVTTPAQYLGVSTSSYGQTINCSSKTVAVGLHLRTGGIEDAFGLNCASVTGATQTITFNAPATQTTTSSLTVTATTTSSSTVSFTTATAAICTVTTSGVVSFVTSGTCTINANAVSDTNFAAATQVSQSFTVNPSTQSISLSVTPTSSTSSGSSYSQSLTFSTSGSSGTGSKTFSTTNGTASGCTLSSNTSTSPTLTATSNGTCLISVTIASDAKFSSATSSSIAVNFSQAAQTVSFTTTDSSGIITRTYTPAATATSGLSVTITVAPSSASVCSITNGLVTYNAAGTCTLQANQSGNAYYSTATQVTQIISVAPGSAAALAVSTPASGSTSGYGFVTVPSVTVRDSYNNLVSDGTTVTATLSLTKGSTLSPTTFNSTGTATMTANTVNGVATFTGMIIGNATSQALAAGIYTITFSSNGNSTAQVNLVSTAKAYSPYSSANNMAGSLLLDYQFNNANSFAGSTSTVVNLVSQTGDNGIVSSATQALSSSGLHVGSSTGVSVRSTNYLDNSTVGQGPNNLYVKLTNNGANTSSTAKISQFMWVKFDPASTACSSQTGGYSVCNGNLLTESAGTLVTQTSVPSWSLGELAVSGDQLYYQYWTSSGAARYTALVTNATGNATLKLKANVWYHIGLTYDGTNEVLWLNGIAQSSSAITRAFYSGTDKYAWYNIGSGTTANGSISGTAESSSSFYVASYQLYNINLTSSQIKQNYTVGLDANLTGSTSKTYAVADQISATDTFTVTDLSGSPVPGAQVLLQLGGTNNGSASGFPTGFNDLTSGNGGLNDCYNGICAVFSDSNGLVTVPNFRGQVAETATINAFSNPSLKYVPQTLTVGSSNPISALISATNYDYYSNSVVNDILQARTFSSSDIDRFQSFNGSNYLSMAADEPLTRGLSNLTLEAWVKVSGTSCAYCVIAGKENSFLLAISTGTSTYVSAGANNLANEIVWATMPNNGNSAYPYWTWIGSGISIPANEWEHIALVRSVVGSTFTISIYLNGILVYSPTTTANAYINSNGQLTSPTITPTSSGTSFNQVTSSAFMIGARGFYGNYNSGFNGGIDEVHLYNIALSQTAIQSDMASATRCGTAGLVAYYDFNDNSSIGYSRCSSSAFDLTFLASSGWSAPTSTDLTTVVTSNGETTISFNRSVINQAGGYTVPANVTKASAVVVAGGGGGGFGNLGGGGGGGGVLVNPSLSLTPGSVMSVKVGFAGNSYSDSWAAGYNKSIDGENGGDSQFSNAIAKGGGGGGGLNASGKSGGSGGGGPYIALSSGGSAVNQNPPSGWTAYGSAGYAGGSSGGGGGGGAGAAATNNNGGNGINNNYTLNVAYGGGGGGYAAGTGGTGGGSTYVNVSAIKTSGTPNTGGGGGGGSFGGTGIVVLRYITAKPTFTNPTNIVTTSGVAATFSISNTPISGLNRSYQWYVSTDTGTTWVSVSNGSTNVSTGAYTTPITTTSMSGNQYRVVVTDTEAAGNGLAISDTSTAATLTVNPPLLLSANPTSITTSYGSATSSIFTATQGTGTKTFTFTPSNIAGITLDTSTASSGAVTLRIAASTLAGTYNETITATDTATATTSTPISITINKVAISHSVSASSTSPTIGTSITLYDTVTSSVAGTITPTGAVTFKDASNNTLCGPATLNGAGVASCTYTPINTNSILISASYAGDSNYLASTSTAISVTPGKASILVTGGDAVSGFSASNTSNIVTSTSTSTSVSFTGTLSSYVVGTSPTGTIAVTENGKSACVGTVSSNSATCSWTPNDIGTLSITFTYSGDANYNGATNSIVLYASLCTETTTATYLLGVPGAGYCGIKFTSGSSASFTVPTGVQSAAMVVVGGGGAGGYRAGGGGGAGALLYNSAYALSSSTYSVTIGAGGPSGATSQGACGSDSSFGSVIAGGGGGGGGGGNVGSMTCSSAFVRATPANTMAGFTGGSAGGSDGTGGVIPANANQTTPSGWTLNQNAGGNGSSGGGPGNWTGGGGGGASGAGTTGSSSGVAGNGGAGYSPLITYDGNSTCLAGGGGGGAFYGYTVGTATCGGGSGGNTAVAAPATTQATNAAANTGAGGGGGGFGISSSDQSTNGTVGSGGSGVVIMKYISPSLITTSGNLSVTSNTSITLTETATAFSFTRTIIWQYSYDTGTTWTQIQSSNTNGNPSATCMTSTCTFAIHYGDGTNYHPTQWFRSVISDTDGALITQSYSPVITITVSPISLIKIAFTSTMATFGAALSLTTAGGPTTGSTSYIYSFTNGTSTGCSITSNTLTTSSAGTCLVRITTLNIDYVQSISDTTTITFVAYVVNIPVAPAPPAASPVIGISGGATQITSNGIAGITGVKVGGVAATTGPINGTVEIDGSGFTGTVAVSFLNSRNPSVAFTVVSDSVILATIPSTAGSGVIIVKTAQNKLLTWSGFSWS